MLSLLTPINCEPSLWVEPRRTTWAPHWSKTHPIIIGDAPIQCLGPPSLGTREKDLDRLDVGWIVPDEPAECRKIILGLHLSAPTIAYQPAGGHLVLVFDRY